MRKEKWEELLQAGKSNVSGALVYKERIIKGVDQDGIDTLSKIQLFKVQPCFALIVQHKQNTTPVEMWYRFSHKEDFGHHPFTNYDKSTAKAMCRRLFCLPYVRNTFKNKSFEDAWSTLGVLPVKPGMKQSELFLGPYLLRHVYERQSYKVYAVLKAMKLGLTRLEMTILSTHMRYNDGALSVSQGGHSVSCNNSLNKEYIFGLMCGVVPTFYGGLFARSPEIISTWCSGGRPNSPIPSTKIGEGWSAKYSADVLTFVKEFKKFKKEFKNA